MRLIRFANGFQERQSHKWKKIAEELLLHELPKIVIRVSHIYYGAFYTPLHAMKTQTRWKSSHFEILVKDGLF